MLVSVCTPTINSKLKEYHDDKTELLYSHKKGIGAAREDLMIRSQGDLIVMLDDDITVKVGLAEFLLSLKSGEFAMAKVGNHVSTRVFAIHRLDYHLTDGFDSSIKYVFEDGAFYVDAINKGLKFREVPADLYSHREHVNRTGDSRKFASWWEHSKMLVKYKHYVYPGIVGFFGLRSAIKQPHILLVKTVGVIYWVIWSKLN
jgi:glycosyltransferase involved in cell wall biosynthesis